MSTTDADADAEPDEFGDSIKWDPTELTSAEVEKEE
jgi:hypothetical protein